MLSELKATLAKRFDSEVTESASVGENIFFK